MQQTLATGVLEEPTRYRLLRCRSCALARLARSSQVEHRCMLDSLMRLRCNVHHPSPPEPEISVALFYPRSTGKHSLKSSIATRKRCDNCCAHSTKAQTPSTKTCGATLTRYKRISAKQEESCEHATGPTKYVGPNHVSLYSGQPYLSLPRLPTV